MRQSGGGRAGLRCNQGRSARAAGRVATASSMHEKVDIQIFFFLVLVKRT